jgi:hypothetical protein
VLRLSASGESVYREIAPVALRYERALIDSIDDTELRVLDTVLDKLTAQAHALASRGRPRKT